MQKQIRRRSSHELVSYMTMHTISDTMPCFPCAYCTDKCMNLASLAQTCENCIIGILMSLHRPEKDESKLCGVPS
jgi:hypothetical protein